LNPAPDAGWGLHILDVNIAYGEPERILAAQAASYLAARGKSLRLAHYKRGLTPFTCHWR